MCEYIRIRRNFPYESCDTLERNRSMPKISLCYYAVCCKNNTAQRTSRSRMDSILTGPPPLEYVAHVYFVSSTQVVCAAQHNLQCCSGFKFETANDNSAVQPLNNY